MRYVIANAMLIRLRPAGTEASSDAALGLRALVMQACPGVGVGYFPRSELEGTLETVYAGEKADITLRGHVARRRRRRRARGREDASPGVVRGPTSRPSRLSR